MEIDHLKNAICSWNKMESAVFFWMKSEKTQETEKEEQQLNEKEEPDYREKTQGDRNAKHLDKARMYANTPQARLKRERTLLKKELRG